MLEVSTQPTTTSVVDMEQTDLRRLSSMDVARRDKELKRRKRKEITTAESPRLRTLLQQRDKIEQQIQIERAKLKNK